MEALGLVLIDESFRSLREMLRGPRAGKLDTNRVIESTVEILVAGVTEQREHWRFIGRERSSGVTVLRYAIRTEIRLITSELATDLARFPELTTWSTEDLNILASLFVNSMIIIAEAIEDAPDAAALRRSSAPPSSSWDDHHRGPRLAQLATRGRCGRVRDGGPRDHPAAGDVRVTPPASAAGTGNREAWPTHVPPCCSTSTARWSTQLSARPRLAAGVRRGRPAGAGLAHSPVDRDGRCHLVDELSQGAPGMCRSGSGLAPATTRPAPRC